MSVENRKSSAVSSIPVAGLMQALAIAVAAALAGFGGLKDPWRFRSGFTILKWVAYGGLAAALVSLPGAVAAGKKGYPRICRESGRLLIHQAFFRVKEKVDPFPGVLSTETLPPWSWTMCLTMARPSPVPPCSRLRAASTR